MKMNDQARVGNVRRRAARVSVYVHLGFFLLVNSFLVLINATAATEEWWVVWPILYWGLALEIHAALVFAVPQVGRLKFPVREMDRAPRG